MFENTLLKQTNRASTEQHFFHLFFLKNDEDYNVEVEEIDFTKIIERPERGESVFISPKRKQESGKKSLLENFPKKTQQSLGTSLIFGCNGKHYKKSKRKAG